MLVILTVCTGRVNKIRHFMRLLFLTVCAEELTRLDISWDDYWK